MELWIEKERCTGCGVCSNICPKKAIKMQEDECGFKYPMIDEKTCINCGLCNKVCPVFEKRNNPNRKEPLAYAAWSKDQTNRYTSTSGGIFSEIAKVVIEEAGVVVGAKYNDKNLVEHSIARNNIELEELKQSKYLQSDTKNIYSDVKKVLDSGKFVAFCGSPCQISGLYKFLKKEYSNLLSIEFICRGMNSPKAYNSWLKSIENKEKKKIIKVWFKYKKNGWKKSPLCTRIDFEDGTFKVFEGEENTYMKGYLGPNLYIRQSCGNCMFNGLPREADITLADFWGIDSKLDDDLGTSLILSNSINGDKWIEKIKNNLVICKKSVSEVEKGNSCFTTSVTINKNSKRFLKEINDYNFDALVKKYSKVSLFRKGFNKINRIARKIKNNGK